MTEITENDMARMIGRCHGTLEYALDKLDNLPEQERSPPHERIRAALKEQKDEIEKIFFPERKAD